MENVLSKKFYQQYIMMIEWVNIYINALDDKELEMELSPGKNHGVWILGHLIASDDDFSVYMGKGELLFPEYSELFGQGSKLKKVSEYPEVSKLREQWMTVFEKNKKIYVNLRDEEFEEIPENMDEDGMNYFTSKGKVIMAWQLHQMYHGGQLSVLAARVGKKMF
ncbi:MAG TPA: DinB family protein [Ignavibacteria bacterium]|nr:DinB family protein [Ignavibacteria bacterium]